MRIFLNKVLNFLKEKPTEHIQITEYEELLKKIEKIDTESFNNFNSNQSSLFSIRTLYKCIEIYINKLKEVNGYLSKDKIIYNAWCDELIQNIKVNNFFLNEKDHYINETKVLEDFKNLIIVFFSLYYEHSSLSNVGEHNKRVLTIFKEGLEKTIEDLISICEKLKVKQNGN